MVAIIIVSVVCFLLLCVAASGVRIVKQTNKYIVERLGAYKATWGVGFHYLIPFIDRVSKVVSMKEQIRDFDPQPVITKDNVTMQIDTVVFFK